MLVSTNIGESCVLDIFKNQKNSFFNVTSTDGDNILEINISKLKENKTSEKDKEERKILFNLIQILSEKSYLEDHSIKLLQNTKYKVFTTEERLKLRKRYTDSLKIRLLDHQIDNLFWMHDIEGKIDKMWNVFYMYPFNITKLGNQLFVDSYAERIYYCEPLKNKVKFRGGMLYDAAGYGKTITCLALSLTDKQDAKRLVQFRYVYHLGVTSKYQIITNATLILCPNKLNQQWYNEINKISQSKSKICCIRSFNDLSTYYYKDLLAADFVIVSYEVLYSCISKLLYKTDSSMLETLIMNYCLDSIDEVDILERPVKFIHLLYWQRIIFDESSHLANYKKSDHLVEIVSLISSKYRWCLTSDPMLYGFESLLINLRLNILDSDDHSLKNKSLITHFISNLSRKTHYIPNKYQINNKLLYIDLSTEERNIYNIYLNMCSNNSFDISIRQFCSYPFALTSPSIIPNNCKSLDKIYDCLTTFSKNNIKLECEHLDELVTIKEDLVNQKNQLILTSELNISYMKSSLSESLSNLVKKILRVNKEINTINKKIKTNESDMKYLNKLFPEIKNEENHSCPICLSEIADNKLVITSCAHIYCYDCINELSQTGNGLFNCPKCRKECTNSDIYIASDVKLNSVQTNRYGTKISKAVNLIKELVKRERYIIIFSTWSETLRMIENYLNSINLYTYSLYRSKLSNKLIKNLSANEKYKILLFRYDQSIVGINLHMCNEIIFLDPAYNYKDSKKYQTMALDKVLRLSNNNNTINVTNIICRNSVEEYIYNNFLRDR